MLLQLSFLTAAVSCALLGLSLFAESAAGLVDDCAAALLIHDGSKAQELAFEAYRLNPSSQTLGLKIRASCLAGDYQGAQQLLQAQDLRSLQDLDTEVLSTFAWAFLTQKLKSSPVPTWLQVCESIQGLSEVQASYIVLAALDHPDLRVKLAGLDLVASYPQDAYRGAVIRLWHSQNQPILRARLLELTTSLGWESAKTMAEQISHQPQLTAIEIIAVANWKMSSSHLDEQAIFQSCKHPDAFHKRIGAWMIRYCKPNTQGLCALYELLLTSEDSLCCQIALDSLAHFHVRAIDEALACQLALLCQTNERMLALQAQWTLALHKGPQGVEQLWDSLLQMHNTQPSAQALWDLCQISALIAAYAPYNCSPILRAWNAHLQLP